MIGRARLLGLVLSFLLALGEGKRAGELPHKVSGLAGSLLPRYVFSTSHQPCVGTHGVL